MTTQVISSGVTQTGFNTVARGDKLEVLSGGIAEDTRVDKGAVLYGAGVVNYVDDRGLVSGVLELANSSTGYGIAVEFGGIVSNIRIGNGLIDIYSGGFARGVTISSGGGVYVYDGCDAADMTVQSGGLVVLYTGATDRRTVVESSGTTIVSSGGEASGTTVQQGGVLRLATSGAAANAHVVGGVETILRGSEASASVLSGGYEFDYGLASSTVVRSGGHEVVEGAAFTRGSVISSGGRERVMGNAGALTTTIFNGGTLIISPGGSVVATLIIHAGKAIIDGGMGGGQVVNFVGTAGLLELNNLPTFAAPIYGFGGASEKIDLGQFAFTSSETAFWTQTGASGTLTVRDGAKTASLTLNGTYATSDFELSSYGSGTLIKAITAPDIAAATTRFNQAVAGIEGGRSVAAASTIHGGGSTLSDASSLVATVTSGR